MSESNGNNRTLREIISDATDAELERYETGTMTPDRLKELAADAARKQRKKYRRIAGLAALFVIVVAGAIMVFDFIDADVEADKNSKEEIVTEDGSIIIEDGGWGSSSEDGWTITDWKEVEIAKATIPELVVPGYVPEGYEFDRLNITGMEGGHKICKYIFLNKEKRVVVNEIIRESELSSYSIEHYDEVINCIKGKIYILYLENKKAIIQNDDGIVVEVVGNLTNQEFIKIIETLKL